MRQSVGWSVAVTTIVSLLAAMLMQTSRLGREMAQLDQRISRLESRQKEAATKTALREIQERLVRIDMVPEAVRKDAEVASPPPPPSPATLPQDEAVVAGDAGGERKLPLYQIGKELELDPVTQGRVAEIANGTKKQIFDLLRTPRPDGTNLADDMLDAFMGDDPAKTQQVFGKMYTDQVPGRPGETYMSAMGKIRERAVVDIRGLLRPDIFQKFEHMAVNPENVETGYDAWAEYLKEKGR